MPLRPCSSGRAGPPAGPRPGTSPHTPATPASSQLPRCQTTPTFWCPTRTPFSPQTHQNTCHLHSRSPSPGERKVRVGLLLAGGGRLFQSLQERRQGARTRGRHVGRPAARTGSREKPVTDGNSPAAARRDAGPHPPGPPRLQAPTGHIHAPGALPRAPDLLLRPATRIQARAAPQPRPSPAITFPGSFQQGEETGVGREKLGKRGILPRGGRGAARRTAPRGVAL